MIVGEKEERPGGTAEMLMLAGADHELFAFTDLTTEGEPICVRDYFAPFPRFLQKGGGRSIWGTGNPEIFPLLGGIDSESIEFALSDQEKSVVVATARVDETNSPVTNLRMST